MTQGAVASDILHYVAMKFMDDRYVHHQVLHPSQLDIFDKQISSALPTAFRDIPNSGHIARALTDGLERLQEDLVRVISVAGVFLAGVNMITMSIEVVTTTSAHSIADRNKGWKRHPYDLTEP